MNDGFIVAVTVRQKASGSESDIRQMTDFGHQLLVPEGPQGDGAEAGTPSWKGQTQKCAQ